MCVLPDFYSALALREARDSTPRHPLSEYPRARAYTNEVLKTVFVESS